MIKKYIKIAINFFRIIPAVIIIFASSSKDIIIFDTRRWMELDKMSSGLICSFCLILIDKKEFRNLVVYRLCKQGYVGSLIFRFLFPPMGTLYINCNNIGKGLYIQHGFSTIVAAKSIGENCIINQQVTIGYEGDKNPVIGNNVHICAGAIVIGGCRVGDNSVVGAGAVVVKDIPPNEVWGGGTGLLSEKIMSYVDGREYERIADII